jgi:hypothetical protein
MSNIYIKQLWQNDHTKDITLINKQITKKFEEFEMKSDVKYLTKNKADPIYLNVGEIISQNLNLNNNKILNLANPESNNEAVNKKYCDDKVSDALKKPLRGKMIEQITKSIKESIGSNNLRAFNYLELMNTYKPVLWISAYNPNVLSSLSKIKCLMGSKIYVEGDITIVDKDHGKALNFDKNNQRIKSDIMFEKIYTFFLVAHKVNLGDVDSVFSSNFEERAFGWNGQYAGFRLGKDYSINFLNVDGMDLHCFIVTNNNGNIVVEDYNEDVTDTPIRKQSMICPDQFGKIFIGYPSRVSIQNKKSFVYEVIAFDRVLTNENIQIFKDFLKRHYPALAKIKKSKNIAGVTTLNNEEQKLHQIFNTKPEIMTESLEPYDEVSKKSIKKAKSNLADSYF